MLRPAFAALAAVCLIACAAFPAAAQVKISALPAPSSVTGGALLPCTIGSTTYKCTAAQVAALAPATDISGKANKSGDTFTGLVAFSTIKPTMLGYSPWTTQDFNYLPAGLGANTFTGLQTLNGRAVLNATGAVDDAYTFAIERTSNFTGGTVGYVNRGFSCHTTVSGSPNDYEWCGVFVLDNSATGAGQHVGAYFQGNRRAAGVTPTWAAVSEAKDWSGAADPTTGLIAHEFDVEANGTDNNFNRVGLDIFAKTKSGGASAEVGYGLRLSTAGGASFKNAMAITGSMYAGLLMNPSSATIGINFLGSYSGPGIDFSQATSLGSNRALRFARGQGIALEATGVYNFLMPAASGIYASQAVAAFANGLSEAVGLDMSAGSEGLRVNTVPMVGRDPNSALYLPGAYSSDLALRLPNAAGGTLRFQTYGGASTMADCDASACRLYVPLAASSWGSFTNVDGVGFGLRITAGAAGASTLAFQNSAGSVNNALITAGSSGDLNLNPASGKLTLNSATLFANSGSYVAVTPSVAPLSGSFTSYTSAGRWQRVGGSVHFNFTVTFGGGTGSAPLVGLPVASANSGVGAACAGRDTTTGAILVGQINPNQSVLSVSRDGTNYAPGSDTMVMSCTYEG